MHTYDIDQGSPELSRYETQFIEKWTDLEQDLSTDFEPYLLRNVKLFKLLIQLQQYKRAKKVYDCGTYTSWALPVDLSEKPFLVRANFCKDRLCSMCAWRRSLKVFSQVSRVMDEIQNGYRFIFVTLTLRNVPSGELTRALDHLSNAFNLFMTYAKCRKAFKGFFKAVEITRNMTVTEHQWHPHLHIIFAVDKDNYFNGRYYITYKELRELWQRALGVDYAPHVDIRAIKGDQIDPEADSPDSTINVGKAVAEVAKYALKTDDLFKGSQRRQLEAVLTLTDALKGRRLCSFGGVLKETARKLKLDDLEEGDLTDQDKIRSDVGYHIINCSWQVGYGFFMTREKEINYNVKRRKRK